MDWTADSEGVRAQLMSIVALLLGLATLAERASRAPLGVRLQVMDFLKPAERAALAFIAGEADLPEPAGAGDDPAPATRLAQRFRALAIALAAFADRFTGCGRAGIGVAPVVVTAAGDFTELRREGPPPVDTS